METKRARKSERASERGREREKGCLPAREMETAGT
jgi:hypothetical protein